MFPWRFSGFTCCHTRRAWWLRSKKSAMTSPCRCRWPDPGMDTVPWLHVVNLVWRASASPDVQAFNYGGNIHESIFTHTHTHIMILKPCIWCFMLHWKVTSVALKDQMVPWPMLQPCSHWCVWQWFVQTRCSNHRTMWWRCCQQSVYSARSQRTRWFGSWIDARTLKMLYRSGRRFDGKA